MKKIVSIFAAVFISMVMVTTVFANSDTSVYKNGMIDGQLIDVYTFRGTTPITTTGSLTDGDSSTGFDNTQYIGGGMPAINVFAKDFNNFTYVKELKINYKTRPGVALAVNYVVDDGYNSVATKWLPEAIEQTDAVVTIDTKIKRFSVYAQYEGTWGVYEINLFNGQEQPSVPNDLTANASNSIVSLQWEASAKATGYNVKRSNSQNGPYTTIVTNVTGTTYMDTNVTSGITYYYVVTAVNASGESGNSNEASATVPVLKPQLNVVIAEEKVNVGQEFISNLVLKNVKDIYAEDFTIQYDKVHLEYLGFEEVPGYKVYNTPADTDGKLRFVVASQGASYGINAETTFLKLKFKAKAVGIAKVDATKARIADTTAEFDLEEANCLEDTVIIENQDVNMSGEYTLLDLAIDAAHFGELGSTVDPTKYVANQVGDDTIRDEDLVFIVAQMLANTNYAPNNK